MTGNESVINIGTADNSSSIYVIQRTAKKTLREVPKNNNNNIDRIIKTSDQHHEYQSYHSTQSHWSQIENRPLFWFI